MDWRRCGWGTKGILDCGARDAGCMLVGFDNRYMGADLRMLIVVALAACLIAEAQAAPDLKAGTT